MHSKPDLAGKLGEKTFKDKHTVLSHYNICRAVRFRSWILRPKPLPNQKPGSSLGKTETLKKILAATIASYLHTSCIGRRTTAFSLSTWRNRCRRPTHVTPSPVLPTPRAGPAWTSASWGRTHLQPHMQPRWLLYRKQRGETPKNLGMKSLYTLNMHCTGLCQPTGCWGFSSKQLQSTRNHLKVWISYRHLPEPQSTAMGSG